MMTTISDKDRAEAQAMSQVFYGRGVVRAPSDGSVRRWLAVRDHVLAAHECPTVPVWRPTTAAEIQPGWEVRSRRDNGSEVAWGIAHHLDDEGDWRTEAGTVLTWDDMGWTCETTAPLPDPEPDLRVGLLEGVCLREGVVLTRSDAALLLSIADAAAPNSPPETAATDATGAPVTPAAPDAINPPPNPSAAVTEPHNTEGA